MARSNWFLIFTALLAALFFIPQFKDWTFNLFRNAMMWIIIVLGIVFIWSIIWDGNILRMNKDKKKNMFGFALLGVLLLVIFVQWPGVFRLERAALIGDTPLEEESSSVIYDYLPLNRDERVTQAVLTVSVNAKIDCTGVDYCNEKGPEIPYTVSVGMTENSLQGFGQQDFPVATLINDWMDYCSVDQCNVPIYITPSARSIVTLNLVSEKTTITHTPARIVIERQGVPGMQIIGIFLFVIALLLMALFIIRTFWKRGWAWIIKILNRIGVR